MSRRIAACSCGQLRVTCEAEPERVSICHCLECQKRTGSVFAAQARFAAEAVTIEGRASRWTRVGESGEPATFSFCPTCGATVCWERAGSILVATGAFADPTFPPPQVAVYEERQHPWVPAIGELTMERHF